MNTKDLKKYIDEVLGDSVRCLLPSYWWKKLFHSVADRIDEAEATVSDMVVKSLKEFETKYPDIERSTLYYTTDLSSSHALRNVTILQLWVTKINANPESIGKPLYIAVPFSNESYYVIQHATYRLNTKQGLDIEFLNIPFPDGKIYNVLFSVGNGGAERELASSSSGGGSDITVDSTMSSTSTNPVQNKVVYSEFQKKQNMISDLADIRSGAALGKTALQQADIADLATKDDITNLTNEINTNEKVHAAALNDLNERLNNGGGSSGGSGVVTFYIPSGDTQTEEEKAKNKAAYEAYFKGDSFPAILIIGGDKSGFEGFTPVGISGANGEGLMLSVPFINDNSFALMYFVISPDGSVMLQQ